MTATDATAPMVTNPITDSPSAADATASAPAGAGFETLEAALLASGAVTPAAVERANRVRARLESPRPLHEVLLEMGALSTDQLETVKRRRRARLSLAALLVEDGALDPASATLFEQARALEPGRSDRDLLVEDGLVTEEQFLRALGARLDIPFIEPEIGEIQTDLYRKIPFAYLMKNLVLPLRIDHGSLHVTVATPENDALVGEVERSFGLRARRFCSTGFRIAETLRTLERLRGMPADRDTYKIQYRELDRSFDGPVESGDEAIQLVDYLLSRAMEMGASDLHIEPTPGKVRARVRIDGILHHLTDLPIDYTARIVARIKILARIDVTEKRLHQDGKIHIRIGGREIDIRVSTYVSVFGETVVMRLLDRDRGILPLDHVGFQPRILTVLRDSVLSTSSGMVLTVGPTGSGKTTTLYSFIQHTNDPRQKVITCEEPVEYVIDGIIQCTVNAKTGPTFADSLRAIVRQDPDTIVVGEIRDPVTAHLATEAALTGHKVFSTLHTEDAVGAFVRLTEIGIEPFLVASTVAAVVAQRLVRRLCPECRVPHRPTAGELRLLGLGRDDMQGFALRRAKGCGQCSSTGYRGRIAIHEVLVPDDRFREAVLARASSGVLRELARSLPAFLTMQEDGLLKACSGATSLAEVITNAPRDLAPRSPDAIRRIARAQL